MGECLNDLRHERSSLDTEQGLRDKMIKEAREEQKRSTRIEEQGKCATEKAEKDKIINNKDITINNKATTINTLNRKIKESGIPVNRQN